MTREIDLTAYLPPFMQMFQETDTALKAEDPELMLVWNAADRVLRNQFIETADEYGISRFEKMLNILSYSEDTLESRRARVQARWFNMLPYTLRTLISKLISLCGETDFSIERDFQHYTIKLKTNLELYGQVDELRRIIDDMLPVNMVIVSDNEIICNAGTTAFAASGVVSTAEFTITNDFKEQYGVNTEHKALSGAVFTEFFEVCE